MNRYKSFGSFVAWYIGPSDEIALLRKRFRKRVHRPGVRLQPYQFPTPADVHDLVKDLYPDRDQLAIALVKAKAAFNSPAHSEQVEQGRGWHSRDRPKRLA